MFIIIMMLVFLTKSLNCIPIDNSPLHNQWHRSLAKRALSYIANDTVCIIDNLIYQNGDPIPTDDPCESCKCRPPGFACVLRECDVKPGCKEIPIEGECCPSYQCAGCEHDGKFYKDGDIVPHPNKLFNCYRCKCKGSSIICGLVDCQFRYDCQSRYRPGECCPNYDHCDTSSTQKQTLNNQTSFSFTMSTESSTSINDLVTPETIDKQIENSTPELSSRSPLDDISTTLDLLNELSSTSTKSSIIVSSTQKVSQNHNSLNRPEDDSHKADNEANNDVNNDTIDDTTIDTNNELNRVDLFLPDKLITTNALNDVKTIQTSTSSSNGEIVASNINLQNKITQSPTESNEFTPLNSIQGDQIDTRVDEIRNDEIKNDVKTNEEFSLQPTTLSDSIKPITFQSSTTAQTLVNISVPSSTTIPNTMDTTILAPNNSSNMNSITQSPILKDKKDQDLEELSKNDSSTEKDDLKAEEEEENLVKKLEAKLEEKLETKLEAKLDEKLEEKLQEKNESGERVSIDRMDDVDEEIRIPIELLKKVLDNCKDGRCNRIEKLIEVTEDVLKEYDSRIVEKVKLTDSFEQLKLSLLGNSTFSTDSPIMINSTESGIVLLDDEQYPTTVRFLKTSELVAEHKDAGNEDLELEDEVNKTFRF